MEALISFWGKFLSDNLELVRDSVETDARKDRLQAVIDSWSLYMVQTTFNLMTILTATINITEELLTKQENGDWISYTYPSQLSYILLGANYLKDKLEDYPYKVRTELSFWKEMNDLQLSILIHSFDPSEEEFMRKGFSLRDDLRSTMIIEDTVDVLTRIRSFVEYTLEMRPKSIIKPSFLAIMRKLTDRSIIDLNYLH